MLHAIVENFLIGPQKIEYSILLRKNGQFASFIKSEIENDTKVNHTHLTTFKHTYAFKAGKR